MRRTFLLPLLFCAATSQPLFAQTEVTPQARQSVIDLSSQAIRLRSVRGEGNQTAQVAELFRDALLDAGWAQGEIEIVPLDDTAYFIATWQGSDPSLGPVVLSAHLDVVEADPDDWERDPFTPVIENGLLYGRGASDTKFDAALALVSVMELRRQGYQPRRSIVIAYSGDEETTMATSKVIAERLRGADIVLNVDSQSGRLTPAGQPMYWSWQGSEKTYVDYRLEVTNSGGHSSMPRPDNAIVQLATAMERIGAYNFQPEINDISRAALTAASELETDAEMSAALQAFLADMTDADALATLRASPLYVGQIATTCVPTMIDGGHAENALPQRAQGVVNCRIFPGHSRDEIMAELAQVANVPQVTFSDMTGDMSIESDASPLRADFLAAARKALDASWGADIPIIPVQSVGASDSMWYRALGVPSYGASPTMIAEEDEYAHGLNERVPLSNIEPGLTFYFSILQDLTS